MYLTIFVFMVFHAFCQDTSVQKARDTCYSIVHGKVLLANAGFAPIPAFSFNTPVAIGFLSIKKNRFSYEPDFSLGLNGKPWMANNWFRLTFLGRKKLKLGSGINPSLFFRNERIASGEEIVHAHRNLTFELVTRYTLHENMSFIITYMHVHAFDSGASSGNFIDISSAMSTPYIRDVIKLAIKPQLFYFNFDGDTDGLFTSVTLLVDVLKIPLSFYYQAVSPIWMRFDGNRFKSNGGLIYSFSF